MSIYKNFYDNISSEKTNEQFASEIKNSVKPVKKLNVRKFMPVGIAAAAMALATVTASAAGWDLSGVINSIFKGGNNAITENIADVTVQNVISKTDETTIEVLGGLKDNNWTAVFLEVTRNDGMIFDNSKHAVRYKNGEVCEECDWEFAYDVKLDIAWNYGAVPVARQFAVDDGCPNDNRMTFAVCFETEELEKYGDMVNLMINSVIVEEYYIKEELTNENGDKTWSLASKLVEVPDCYWSADIKTEIEKNIVKEIPFNEKLAVSFYNHAPTVETLEHTDIDFMLKELAISDFSLSVRLEAPVYSETMYFELFYFNGEVVLKDGTEVSFGGDPKRAFWYQYNALDYGVNVIIDKNEPWVVKVSCMLEKPIDLEEIDYVTINGTRFGF